jgi:hypothetical protein
MTIPFTCPHCHSTTKIDERFVGQSGPCRACGKTVTVGSIPSDTPAAPGSGSGIATLVVMLLTGIVLLVCGGGVLALLIPTVARGRQAASEPGCQSNLKQLGLALHIYHDQWNCFPPAYTVDQNGEPLHSWRTLLLPYLEQEALYRQIDLNKPWNSPENLRFSRTVVPVFQCPRKFAGPDTHYLAVVGPNCVFQGPDGVAIPQIIDGVSKTLMVVEDSRNRRSWMEPHDLDATTMPQEFTRPGPAWSDHPGGTHACLADGSVRLLSATLGIRNLEELLNINGTEASVAK